MLRLHSMVWFGLVWFVKLIFWFGLVWYGLDGSLFISVPFISLFMLSLIDCLCSVVYRWQVTVLELCRGTGHRMDIFLHPGPPPCGRTLQVRDLACLHACMHTRAETNTHAEPCTHTQAHTHKYPHKHTLTNKHSQTNTHKQTNTHTHKHTQLYT